MKTGTAYAESSFLAGLRLRDLKKIRLRLRPWARIPTLGTSTPTPYPCLPATERCCFVVGDGCIGVWETDKCFCAAVLHAAENEA